MIEFIYHDDIQKEIAALERRFRQLRDGFKAFEKLCNVQFNPENPRQVIAPGKLHRVSQNDIWTLWKIEMVIPKSGLRPNQFPRVWFAVRGAFVAFLCIATHIDNYDDGDMEQLAIERMSGIF